MTLSIGTHSGTFHCDEVLACYMLRLLPQFAGAPVTRTRDPAVLAALDCVVDVGAEYDPDRLRFDHHQREFETTFSPEKSIKLSSAGLVYKHFGKDVLRSVTGCADDATIDVLYPRVYDSFIEAIDGNDNGVNPTDERPRYAVNTTLPARISRINTPWNAEVQNQDERFAQAMQVAGRELEENIKSLHEVWLPARGIVRAAYERRREVHPSGRVMLLERFCPWKAHLYELEEEKKAEEEGKGKEQQKGAAGGNSGGNVQVLYVLYEDDRGTWRMQTVSKQPSSFESRLPLPEKWRGLRDAELDRVARIDHCTFVHASGFTGGNRTYAGALAMVNAALSAASV